MEPPEVSTDTGICLERTCSGNTLEKDLGTMDKDSDTTKDKASDAKEKASEPTDKDSDTQSEISEIADRDQAILALLDQIKHVNWHMQHDYHMETGFVQDYLRFIDDYRHPKDALPLPWRLKCHKAYKKELEDIQVEMEKVKADIHRHRTALSPFQSQDNTAEDDEDPKLLDEPKDKWENMLDNLNHQKDNTSEEAHCILLDLNLSIDKLQILQGELYKLVTNYEPINVEAFHRQCSALIKEKIKICKSLRLLQIEACCVL